MIIKWMFLIVIVLDYEAKIDGLYFLFSNNCYSRRKKNEFLLFLFEIIVRFIVNGGKLGIFGIRNKYDYYHTYLAKIG